jgi:hypothetical protein
MEKKVAGRPIIGSLESLCRNVVTENLERFPACALGIIDEYEWENITKLKHEQSKPLKGSGGLDGTGRLVPAISDKFLSEVEAELPHLASSTVSDMLIWKDIVNHRFRKGGLSRPTTLYFPYPILEARIKKSGDILNDLRKRKSTNEEDKKLATRAIKCICESPMDMTFLKSSGIGKAVQKFINFCKKRSDYGNDCMSNLASTLESWKTMASASGVVMKHSHRANKLDKLSIIKREESLDLARHCKSWRDLFLVLKEGDKTRRENQGARMRERRQKLNKERPKIVKVRPKSSFRQDNILQHPNQKHPQSQIAVPLYKQSRMQKLRAEAITTSTRRSPPVPKPHNGFGAAVAFASGPQKKRRNIEGAALMDLGGGKRMKIPTLRPPATNFKKKKGTRFLKK